MENVKFAYTIILLVEVYVMDSIKDFIKNRVSELVASKNVSEKRFPNFWDIIVLLFLTS